MKIRM